MKCTLNPIFASKTVIPTSNTSSCAGRILIENKRGVSGAAYFHSQTFSVKLPSESTSASTTPITLLRNDNRSITGSKWDSLVDCSMHVREASVRGIPDDQVKAMRKVLETISKNLMAEYGVDHNCAIKSITSASAPAASNPNRKDVAFKRGTV